MTNWYFKAYVNGESDKTDEFTINDGAQHFINDPFNDDINEEEAVVMIFNLKESKWTGNVIRAAYYFGYHELANQGGFFQFDMSSADGDDNIANVLIQYEILN
eukprot:CAMPEP_0201580852 /NCGR_PEP_ID=MMETSP0190_2-20130828/57298_1 /ASSEMBLY_ACC=CAM_ASM_000263 /TAXON_ID=37353 /ORGANISM="Rosalina sp." /LENGTH=102 /DNA_ID=CAMNT_0048017711 /DNA_START=236 /DNA_END=544 /DNA_ORIENTATION=-